MEAEALFSIASTAVVPGWLLLVFLPSWKWTTRLVTSVLLPSLLALLYVYLIATHWAGAEGGFGSLTDVGRLFDDPALLLAGWVHYLVFDLFVGTWEVRDAQRLGISQLLVVPCLVLTFLFGPIGLLLYFVLRGLLRRRFLLEGA
jgi:hypothetical protein